MSDAILFVSFGGPDRPEDVMPFLENVTRGRGVPRERLEAVAEHYYHFGGKSPINEQNLAIIKALSTLLAQQGPELPIYFGNRNWHPLLPDTLRQMKEDGVTRAFTFVTSAYSSYSGCRQYRENIAAAQQATGSESIKIDKLRVYFNHPGFIAPMIDSVQAAARQLPHARLLFSAHSIPMSMANSSRYVPQLLEASRLVAEGAVHSNWELVYQSRSGGPGQPWLEPDILDRIRALHAEGVRELIVCPIGFISDHMEVLYDLDEEARLLAGELGMQMIRTPTSSTDPRFIAMIRDLVLEVLAPSHKILALGALGPSHKLCPADCCPAPAARPAR
ncbi:ferrochelatase [Bryobacter aggregatus]|uniref:ferrochelatase n=1 Tax=Bryobacter aggregatus TaxID=360054 RepID=UPI0004E1A3B3|nr:ferrochelatase [Bryobacter aggregatus]